MGVPGVFSLTALFGFALIEWLRKTFLHLVKKLSLPAGVHTESTRLPFLPDGPLLSEGNDALNSSLYRFLLCKMTTQDLQLLFIKQIS